MLSVRAAAVGAALFLFAPAPSRAHDFLAASYPAAGAALAAPPTEIRLTFTGRPERAFTRLVLSGRNGVVALAGVEFLPGNVVRVTIPDSLADGQYSVGWRTAGADGHPVSGEFGFTVGAASVAGAGDTTTWEAEGDPFASFGAILRWITLLGMVAAIGAVVFRATVIARVSLEVDHDIAAEYLPRASRKAAMLGLGATLLLILAALARLALRSLEMDAGMFGPMLPGTNWGRAWLVHVAGALLGAVGFMGAWRANRNAWYLAGGGAVLATAGLALASHASMVPRLSGPSVIANVIHTIAASGWLGNLLVVFAVGIPLAWKLDRRDRWTVIRDIVNAFSPAALTFGAVAVVTGVFMAWTHVGSLEALTGTDYGRILLIKVVLLTLTGLVGAYNWLRVRPALGDETGAKRLRRSAGVELGIAALVLAVTAVLVAVPMPRP